MKTIILSSRDRIGQDLISRVRSMQNVYAYYDASMSLPRLTKLLLRGSIPLSAVLKMLIANYSREKRDVSNVTKIDHHRSLYQVLTEQNIERLFLFRCGLIIPKSILDMGIDVYNIHPSKLPDYPGLCSLEHVLARKDYDQHAVIHRVTPQIDSGEIIDIKPYRLHPKNSFRQNEDIAYRASMELLLKHLTK